MYNITDRRQYTLLYLENGVNVSNDRHLPIQLILVKSYLFFGKIMTNDFNTR